MVGSISSLSSLYRGRCKFHESRIVLHAEDDETGRMTQRNLILSVKCKKQLLRMVCEARCASGLFSGQIWPCFWSYWQQGSGFTPLSNASRIFGKVLGRPAWKCVMWKGAFILRWYAVGFTRNNNCEHIRRSQKARMRYSNLWVCQWM